MALQPAVDELNEPANSALPCASKGTSGVSMTVGLAEPGPQTSVPLTWVTGPGVPIVLPPARTSPLTSNSTKPLSSETKTSPSRVDQGWPPPVIPPTVLPACSMPIIENSCDPQPEIARLGSPPVSR
jgi:hypothetical protein